MNIPLLLEVKNRILAEPLQFHMSDWLDTEDEVSPCGTTACIAGWACVLKHQTANPVWSFTAAAIVARASARDMSHEGRDVLDLTTGQADRLFHVLHWPSAFYAKFNEVHDTAGSEAESRKGTAQVAADRIDHFIATEGRE